MREEDKKLLEDNGWFIECESPFEIRHEESESFATNTAAYIILFKLRTDCDKKEKLINELFAEIDTFILYSDFQKAKFKAVIEQLINW